MKMPLPVSIGIVFLSLVAVVAAIIINNSMRKAAEAYDVAQDTAQGKAGKLTSRY